MTFRGEMASLLRNLDAEDNAAFDLWTWLPSYKDTQAHHGDYTSEHKPSNADILREAALVFSLKKYTEQAEIDSWWARNKAEADSFFKCQCGKEHEALSSKEAGKSLMDDIPF
jgi:hypothetical protein